METGILPAGTKVKIKSLEWWNSQPKNGTGSVDCGVDTFTDKMLEYCDMEATILRSLTYAPLKYALDIDNGRWHWTNEMFERIIDTWDYNKPKPM